MLRELQSSSPDSKGNNESESGCETPNTDRQYSYNGTFGPNSSGGNASSKSTPLNMAEILPKDRSFVNRMKQTSKSMMLEHDQDKKVE